MAYKHKYTGFTIMGMTTIRRLTAITAERILEHLYKPEFGCYANFLADGWHYLGYLNYFSNIVEEEIEKCRIGSPEYSSEFEDELLDRVYNNYISRISIERNKP